MSDEELLEAIQRGDGEALSQLYDRYAVLIHRIARQLIDDEQLVQDITQEVFTRIWRNAEYRYVRGSFRSWLYVVTRRLAVDHLRKERRRPQVFVPTTDLDRHISELQNTETTVGLEMLKVELLEFISKLRTEQQLVLKLAYFQGYTLSEIAELLNIPIGTVKTRLHQGLKILRTVMTDWESEVGQG